MSNYQETFPGCPVAVVTQGVGYLFPGLLGKKKPDGRFQLDACSTDKNAWFSWPQQGLFGIKHPSPTHKYCNTLELMSANAQHTQIGDSRGWIKGGTYAILYSEPLDHPQCH